MTTPAIRIAVVCFAISILVLNKPLGRMTAAWQRMIGLGVAANETVNRVFYLIGVDLSNIGDLGELRFSQHTFASATWILVLFIPRCRLW